ncbi:hypothetical protein CC2G_008289 [Coprinopsis cinerea AmutBmut pab1-1]|nr:hypothetical protein CC2G_008289 [Coprinopsis cinerea AmutBmut pab1-1]
MRFFSNFIQDFTSSFRSPDFFLTLPGSGAEPRRYIPSQIEISNIYDEDFSVHEQSETAFSGPPVPIAMATPIIPPLDTHSIAVHSGEFPEVTDFEEHVDVPLSRASALSATPRPPGSYPRTPLSVHWNVPDRIGDDHIDEATSISTLLARRDSAPRTASTPFALEKDAQLLGNSDCLPLLNNPAGHHLPQIPLSAVVLVVVMTAIADAPRLLTATAIVAHAPRLLTATAIVADAPRLLTATTIVAHAPRLLTATTIVADAPRLLTATTIVADAPRLLTATTIVAHAPRLLTATTIVAHAPRLLTATTIVAHAPRLLTATTIVADAPRLLTATIVAALPTVSVAAPPLTISAMPLQRVAVTGVGQPSVAEAIVRIPRGPLANETLLLTKALLTAAGFAGHLLCLPWGTLLSREDIRPPSQPTTSTAAVAGSQLGPQESSLFPLPSGHPVVERNVPPAASAPQVEQVELIPSFSPDLPIPTTRTPAPVPVAVSASTVLGAPIATNEPAVHVPSLLLGALPDPDPAPTTTIPPLDYHNRPRTRSMTAAPATSILAPLAAAGANPAFIPSASSASSSNISYRAQANHARHIIPSRPLSLSAVSSCSIVEEPPRGPKTSVQLDPTRTVHLEYPFGSQVNSGVAAVLEIHHLIAFRERLTTFRFFRSTSEHALSPPFSIDLNGQILNVQPGDVWFHTNQHSHIPVGVWQCLRVDATVARYAGELTWDDVSNIIPVVGAHSPNFRVIPHPQFRGFCLQMAYKKGEYWAQYIQEQSLRNRSRSKPRS